MSFCYSICSNYGIAIIIFTFLSKIILLPISIWVQKNSIKMVKMQPDINKIKIGYFGDKDKIAEETTKLYKKEKYNAFVSLVPLIIQIVLLLGLVEVINQPLTYILDISPNEISAAKKVILQEDSSITEDSSSLELLIVKDIKNGNANKYAISTENIEKINSFNMTFLGFDMSWIALT